VLYTRLPRWSLHVTPLIGTVTYCAEAGQGPALLAKAAKLTQRHRVTGGDFGPRGTSVFRMAQSQMVSRRPRDLRGHSQLFRFRIDLFSAHRATSLFHAITTVPCGLPCHIPRKYSKLILPVLLYSKSGEWILLVGVSVHPSQLVSSLVECEAIKQRTRSGQIANLGLVSHTEKRNCAKIVCRLLIPPLARLGGIGVLMRGLPFLFLCFGGLRDAFSYWMPL